MDGFFVAKLRVFEHGVKDTKFTSKKAAAEYSDEEEDDSEKEFKDDPFADDIEMELSTLSEKVRSSVPPSAAVVNSAAAAKATPKSKSK